MKYTFTYRCTHCEHEWTEWFEVPIETDWLETGCINCIAGPGIPRIIRIAEGAEEEEEG